LITSVKKINNCSLRHVYKFDEIRARTPRWVIGFTSKLQVNKNWSKGRTARNIFGREPFNDYFIKILFLLSKWFQTKRFLWEFPNWLMLLLYPGELYRLLGASSFVNAIKNFFGKWFISLYQVNYSIMVFFVSDFKGREIIYFWRILKCSKLKF
jgi:hypothetical protein